jgi:signal transduction histidine kinase
MNKRLLAIYTVVFILIMTMLYLYRQSYTNLKIFTSEVNDQTQQVIRLQQLELLVKFWLSNDPKVRDDLDLFMPANVAYDSIMALASDIAQMSNTQEQRLRMDSVKLSVRAYQRLVEVPQGSNTSTQHIYSLRKSITQLLARSIDFSYIRLQHRNVRLRESTSLLDRWVFWMLLSATSLIIVATFYSFNFLRLRRRAEGFSNTLLQNTNNGIISFYPVRDFQLRQDYKVTYCNEAALGMLRIPNWKSRTLSTILPPGALPDVEKVFHEVLTTGESKMIEGYIEHNHERNWIQATIAPLEGGILASIYNLNPVKSFQQRLTYQIKQLELANDELQQYAYITSHDLQEPLRKIQMFSDIALNPDTVPGHRSNNELFQKISATANHMRTLIQTLLFFTRSTDQPNEFVLVDLTRILDEVQTEMEVAINEKHARISVYGLPTIQGSGIHLKLLFSNLISNSLKYARQDVSPTIVVHTKAVSREDYEQFNALDQLKKYVCICVRDNGRGFKPELKEKIFTLFQRLHNRDEIPGTGIGLSICRKVVHQHHGHIFAEGRENEGAVFYVYLPIEQPEQENGIS